MYRQYAASLQQNPNIMARGVANHEHSGLPRYKLELVDAETKQPFKEHTDAHGRVYVEVEPEAEYFVRIAVEGRATKTIGRVEVDGEDLGYYWYLWDLNGNGKHHDFGVWSRCNGRETNKALKFARRSAVCRGIAPQQSAPSRDLIGTIKAVFHFAVEGCDEKDWGDHSTRLTSKMPSETHANEKGVETTEGSRVHDDGGYAGDMEYEKVFYDYRMGEIIQTLEVTYCTAPGLIQAGILPKPPLWEYARMMFPRAAANEGRENRDPNMIPAPERKIERRVDGSGRVLETKEYDMFDLTVLPD